MRTALAPILSVLAAVVAIAVLLTAFPAPAADQPVFSGCRTAQGPDEWLPGVAGTTLPTTAPAVGRAYRMAGRKTIAIVLPAAAAGDCSVTLDALTLTSTNGRGWPVLRGGTPFVADVSSDAPVNIVCNAQLVTPNGAKVLQCR
ncbi:MAG: hypothetical protein ACM3UX_01055 [Candidatus Woesearchaeota archaeon]